MASPNRRYLFVTPCLNREMCDTARGRETEPIAQISSRKTLRKSCCPVQQIEQIKCIITIYAPMIYAAPCIMLLMRAASITRASGRGLGPGNREFLGPWKWHRADMQVSFGAQKLEISRAQPPPTCPSNGCCPHQHYTRGCINHSCIGGFMYKSSPCRGLCVHTSIPTCAYTYVS